MHPGEAQIVQESEAIMLDGDDEVLMAEDRREERELPSHTVKQYEAEDGGYGLGRGPGRSGKDRTMDEVLFTPNADRYVDDLTGLPLPPDLCKAARRKELEYFKSKGVWEMRTINEARMKMGRRPISVRWVETNKGDDEHPNIRSRLVAREIRAPGQDAIFAPTRPLESLRMILAMASTALK
jgi:hypothetical protein